jgi:hypothetical protein
VDDEIIRDVVARLARPHPSGGQVIERAAILAEGSDASEVIAWIVEHDGVAETRGAANRGGGLHGGRLSFGEGTGGTPLRYVLPAGALAAP